MVITHCQAYQCHATTPAEAPGQMKTQLVIIEIRPSQILAAKRETPHRPRLFVRPKGMSGQ